jgi:hypothetical protein
MWGSAALYTGVILFLAGLMLTIKPIARLRVRTRRRALAIAVGGAILGAAALFAPAFDSRTAATASRLDEFAPAWQFSEVHSLRVNAPPAKVFEAIRQVRADEILLFRTLTWIRRGGRPVPAGILNPGSQESIVTVATKGGFVILAEEVPRAVPARLRARDDELSGDARRARRIDRVDRNARLRQQSRRPKTVRRLLARHLPRKRAHSPHVAARDRTPRDGVGPMARPPPLVAKRIRDELWRGASPKRA